MIRIRKIGLKKTYKPSFMKWTEKEKEICWLIWGGIPVDIEWAKSIFVYKQFIK